MTSTFTFPWKRGALAALGAFALTFIVISVVGIATTLAEELATRVPLFNSIDPLVFGAAFELVSYLAIFGSAIAFLRLFVGRTESLAEVTKSRLSSLRGNLVKFVVIGVGAYFAAMIVTQLLYSVVALPEPVSPAGNFAKSLSPTAFIFFALSACVAAPILEELLFRGLLQNMLRAGFRNGFMGQLAGDRVADAFGIVLTAAIFAIAHGTLSGFPPLFVMGLALGIVYARTNNLYASMILHAINNIVATIALLTMILH